MAMSAVSTMHEEMHDRTEKQQQVGNGTEQVSPMLFPQEEGRDG
jgi:hypothetical protein